MRGMRTAMAAVTKFIRGYVTDTREYAANTRIRESSIFGHTHIRAYASIREFAGQYQRLSKFTQIFTNTRIGYSPIRGHTRTFAQVHRDVSAYALGHVSPSAGGTLANVGDRRSTSSSFSRGVQYRVAHVAGTVHSVPSLRREALKRPRPISRECCDKSLLGSFLACLLSPNMSLEPKWPQNFLPKLEKKAWLPGLSLCAEIR